MTNALAAIGLSVLMHVSWNLLARHVESRCNFLWWGLLAHLVLLGPWAVWRLAVDSQWNTQLIMAMFITAIANTVYFIALRKAYHYAPVAIVYPIARSSPILITLWAWLLFNEVGSFNAMIGISISVIGLWVLAGTSRNGDTAHALPWALLAALTTSVYSLSDKVAVSYLPSFGSQLGFITIGYLASFIGLSVFQYKESGQLIPPCRPRALYLLLGGLFIGVAYALVVRAMLVLPAAYVVTYTNAGIVLATILSVWIFKERDSWLRRLSAAVIISLGLVILGFGM